jgi:hypothetical protein
MFRAFSRPSSGVQWLQWQPLVLPSYRGDSRAVFVVGPAGLCQRCWAKIPRKFGDECPYFIWQIQSAISRCYSATRLVSQRSGLHSYNKDADRKRQLQLSDKIMTPYFIFTSSG